MNTGHSDPHHKTNAANFLEKNSVAIVAFTIFTSLADGVVKVGIPLTGAKLTQSPLAISALSVATTLPFLLFSLHTGVLVDRFDRRKLVWAAGLTRLLTLCVLLAAALADAMSLPLLLFAGIILGTADVIALTAVSALIPNAVEKRRWEAINSWVMGVETVCSQFIGPLLGGLVLAAGTSVFLGSTAASVALAAAALLLLSGNFRPRQVDHVPAAPAHRQIAEGVVFVWREPTLRLLLAATAVMCACWGAWFALMPLIATNLDISAKEYGVLLSAMGVGGLLGAATVTTLNRLMGRRWVMFVDLVGTVAIVAAPLFVQNTPGLAVAAFLGGLGSALWSVNGRTVSQHLVPDQLRGRYSATARLVGWGPIPIGAALSGVLGEVIGLHQALAVFAIPVIVLTVPFMRAMRHVRLDVEQPGPPAAAEPSVATRSPS